MSQTIASAVFDSETDADRAIQELRSAGVPDSALSIVAHQEGRSFAHGQEHQGDEDDHKGGSIIRGLVGGGALGAGVGVAALAIPGVGPLAALGAIAASATPAAMAAGAGVGAVAAGLGESLRKHGVSDDDADYYGQRLQNGGALVTVDAGTAGLSPEAAQDILYRSGGHNAFRARTPDLR